jgi:hypothetical protein
LHPRLRGTSSHREKWRRLRLITRFNFRRHDLDDPTPKIPAIRTAAAARCKVVGITAAIARR